MVIRSTVKPYEKSGAEASEERPYVPPAKGCRWGARRLRAADGLEAVWRAVQAT